MGGNNLTIDIGVQDQRPVEERTDVLVYTSDPLEQPLEITGPVTVALWASSSAVDTDFTAKLVDVHPNGYAQNLLDGILRARYRESASAPKLMEANKPYLFTIDLWATSNVFLPGHRIRRTSTSFAVKSVSTADDDAHRATVTGPVISSGCSSGSDV